MERRKGRPSADSVRAFIKSLDDKIERFGQASLMVGDDPENSIPSYAYTIGLTERGLPEVLVFGLGDTAGVFLNDVAERLKSGRAVPRNERIGDVFRGFDAVVHDVSPKVAAQFLKFAASRYGERLRCIQLIWPDAQNRMPWEPDHDREKRAAQLLLE